MTTTNQVQEDDQATVLDELRQKIGEEYHNARELCLTSQQRIAHYEKKARISRDHMKVMGSFIDSSNNLKAEAVTGKDVETRATELAAETDDAIREHENDSA